MSSKELMDPENNLLVFKIDFSGGKLRQQPRSSRFFSEAVSLHDNEVVCQASHWRVFMNTATTRGGKFTSFRETIESS